jgi:hypothetical protein
VLFERGQTFTSSSTVNRNSRSGPFIIGAHGQGANPVIYSAHSGTTLSLSASLSDVRIVDVDFTGGYPGGAVGHGLSLGTDSLLLRSRVSSYSYGAVHSGSRKDSNFFVDCDFVNNEKYGIYYSQGRHVAVLGTRFDDVALNGSLKEHLLRTYVSRSLIEHNTFRGANSKHQLKFIGIEPGQFGGSFDHIVRYCIISDNLFEDSGSMDWMITIGPENGSSDQRIEDLIFERNIVRADSGTQVGARISGTDITIRNNVFDGTLANGSVKGIILDNRGIDPATRNAALYNNTAYSNSNQTLIFCNISSDTVDSTVRNNLVSAPNDNSTVVVLGGGVGLVEDHNLLTDTPGMANPSAGDFRLVAGSPAIDVGTMLLSVHQDMIGVVRPVDGNGSSTEEFDVGAFEFVP